MGEIRSTLDIIMEKARGVEVTDEDKAAILRHEVEGKIRGLLQKALDGFIDTDGLTGEIEAMGADRQEMAIETLRRECLEQLVLEGDNTLLLAILSNVARMDTAPVENLLMRYEENLQTRRVNRITALTAQLNARGISGTAVIPNLNADAEWKRYSDEARDPLHREIEGLGLNA